MKTNKIRKTNKKVKNREKQIDVVIAELELELAKYKIANNMKIV